MNKLEINKLTKKYTFDKKEQIILNNLNLRFESGKVYAIVGPSGCGKTTLLNILAGFDTDYTGDVFIGDFKLKDFSKDELANYKSLDLVYIQQNAPYFEKMNIYDNINIFQDGKKVVDLASFNIAAKGKKQINKLSGGEKQRVTIIREASNTAKYILLDEPTASLDKENANLVMNYLTQKYCQEIVILVTHDLDLATRFADEILEMKDGKIKKNFRGQIGPSSYIPTRFRAKIGLKTALKASKRLLRMLKSGTFTHLSALISGLICLGFSIAISTNIPPLFYQQASKITFNNKISVSNNRQLSELDESDWQKIDSEFSFIDYNFCYFLDDDFEVKICTLDNSDEELNLPLNFDSLTTTQLTTGRELADDEIILTYDGSGEDYLMDIFAEEDIKEFFEDNILTLIFRGEEFEKSLVVADLIETNLVPNFSLLHSQKHWNYTFLEDFYPYFRAINGLEISIEKENLMNDAGYFLFYSGDDPYILKESKTIVKTDYFRDYADIIVPTFFDEENFWLNYYNGVFYFDNTTFYTKNNVSFDKSIYFSTDIPTLTLGSFPEINSNQVVVSSALANAIYPSESILNKTIKYEYNGVEKQLLVSGIYEDSLPCIYQNPIWYNTYFAEEFAIDTSNYQVQSYLLFLDDDKNVQETVQNLRKALPDYDIFCLAETVQTALDSILTKVNWSFYILVGINLIIALVSILILSYIEILDLDKQFKIFINKGFSKKDIAKIMFFINLYRALLTIIIALIFCIIIFKSVNSVFTNLFDFSEGILKISPAIILYIAVPAIFVSIISSVILHFHLTKR